MPVEAKPSPADAVTENEVLETVMGLARELHPGGRLPRLGLGSRLDEDAGIDSLARVELLLRLERRFAVALPERSALEARTARDLLEAVARAQHVAGAAPVQPPVPAPELARGTPDEARTLVDVLVWHAEHHGDRVHVELLAETGGAERITYSTLLAEAERAVAGLRTRGVGPGDSIALMLPTCREYFIAFMACLLAGAVPVPIYPPHQLDKIREHLERQVKILANARAVLLVTIPEALVVARLVRSRVASLREVVTGADLLERERDTLRVAARPDDIAFLQYTSGSTGDPKGVILTHANLLANLRALGKVAPVESSDVFVSWLPLYHDMGLIGAWLGSLYFAFRLVSMSPLAFLARPERWLRAIQEHRGTISAAPNFAYELCATRLDDARLAGLDLSSWRLAFNGAEPVRPHTIRVFAERFAPHGFRPEAMTPAYGLAECSVGLTAPPAGRGPRIERIRRDRLERAGRAEPAAATDPEALELVSCGRPIPGHEVRFLDESGRELGEREIGRLEFRGPSATRGYFDNPAATAKLVHAPWVDSGDYGFVADGEVYLTGRSKDLVIRGGRKIYPYELESAVSALPGVPLEGVAVFASAAAESGAERLIVVVETSEDGAASRERLHDRTRQLTLEVLQVPPDDVVLVPPRSIPRTANGKIRRAACRELYERGELGRAAPGARRQLVRFWAASARPRLARAGRVLRAHAFAGYAWLVALLLGAVGALLVLALPVRSWRRRVVRRVARLALLLTGIRVRAHGVESVPAEPCVVVANHACYLDAFVLHATLPPRFGFVAMSELRRSRVVGLLLRRLGTVFVERFVAKESVQAKARMLEAVRRGESLVVFPEGGFRRAVGLRPFHVGAFAVAAETGVPVVPVALEGTRALMHGEELFPHRGAVEVFAMPALRAGGADWPAALRLRDAARVRILERCGEPELLES